MNNDALDKVLEDLNEALHLAGPCADGSCRVVKPKGMHTNGGCRCFGRDQTVRIRAMRVVHAYKLAVRGLCELVRDGVNDETYFAPKQHDEWRNSIYEGYGVIWSNGCTLIDDDGNVYGLDKFYNTSDDETDTNTHFCAIISAETGYEHVLPMRKMVELYTIKGNNWKVDHYLEWKEHYGVE